MYPTCFHVYLTYLGCLLHYIINQNARYVGDRVPPLSKCAYTVHSIHCTVQNTLVVNVLNLYIPYVQKTKLFFHAHL